MHLISNIISVFLIPLMLSQSYPQYMFINNIIKNDNNLKIVEKSINKNLSYLIEDIRILQIEGGKDKNKVDNINSKINSGIMKNVIEAEKTSAEYFKENIPNFPYQILSKYIVSRNDNNILSFYNDYYEFLGGAHGMTTRTSYTINKNKEEFLKLNDLFKSGYNYLDIINKEIEKQIRMNPDNYFDSGKIFKGIDENHNFYLDENNIIIYYQLYDIAPYVYGIPEFKIPISLFDENFIYS
ncbi:DUF3298 and DUF4163 domain-containing protein [Clostridium botulinum]|uniref:DUF3298 and DUF4163 domain-containing protein n=1 Tax=Clostridium botulinum TaxID=1491 RepID=UPI0013F14013|nr:DUF3298 and DUF4163 domain-containing protein [Clostridium botulinum]MBN1069878.1 DUF3298/DUF4163 domain-containing protein [Clostridium botulinum]NFG23490.1 DUF3298 and DUF4163 domain-containing protein [Clostridium botulinum]NFO05415.1 DUF3298 and DUF4163 domain-containing protein [Clostridium botulinum]NFO14325.1 DUF3298 and DUF4163 domain-containing protein [Clostridium botulinum]NFR14233.1 DUF3298 and DUF4163 domain-containing protein [Clostridium botulinum]